MVAMVAFVAPIVPLFQAAGPYCLMKSTTRLLFRTSTISSIPRRKMGLHLRPPEVYKEMHFLFSTEHPMNCFHTASSSCQGHLLICIIYPRHQSRSLTLLLAPKLHYLSDIYQPLLITKLTSRRQDVHPRTRGRRVTNHQLHDCQGHIHRPSPT